MKKIAWSRLIRQTYMNLALFLRPWVLVYALSSIIFNHFKFFSGGKPFINADVRIARPGGAPDDEMPPGEVKFSCS